MRALALALVLALPLWAWAQAEQAPESYRPPRQSGMPQPKDPEGPTNREAQARLPKWRLAVAPHFDVLLGQVPAQLPRFGYGGGVQVTRALLPFGRGRFGVGVDFGYDRFSHDLKTSPLTSGTQLLSHATFAAMAVVDGIAGRVRPWLAIGGGFSVANFESPPVLDTDPKGASRVGVAGLVKLALGVGVRIYEGFELGLRGDLNFTFSGETVNAQNVWQPGYFMLGLDLGYRF